MSEYELNRCIHHVYTDRDQTAAFRGGDFHALDAFDLSAEERAALEGHDFAKLWSLHVHPVLLLLYPREWYLANVVPKIAGVPNKYYDFYSKRAETG
jgi:hypothetical protein